MSDLKYDDLRHNCAVPDMRHLPRYGKRHQVMARWRCPECGARWRYAASFLHGGRMYWEASSGPSRRWRRSEAKRLHALIDDKAADK